MTKPHLFLFAGPPGSGKTSVANYLHQITGGIHLWVDHERQAMFGEVTHNEAESAALYRLLNDRTDMLLADGHNVIFDTNFNYRKDRDYLRTIAAKHGADTTIIWMTTPLNVARERALHSDHRDRNRYQDVMTADAFAHVTAAFEPPSENEPYVTIDGRGLSKDTVKERLGL